MLLRLCKHPLKPADSFLGILSIKGAPSLLTLSDNPAGLKRVVSTNLTTREQKELYPFLNPNTEILSPLLLEDFRSLDHPPALALKARTQGEQWRIYTWTDPHQPSLEKRQHRAERWGGVYHYFNCLDECLFLPSRVVFAYFVVVMGAISIAEVVFKKDLTFLKRHLLFANGSKLRELLMLCSTLGISQKPRIDRWFFHPDGPEPKRPYWM